MHLHLKLQEMLLIKWLRPLIAHINGLNLLSLNQAHQCYAVQISKCGAPHPDLSYIAVYGYGHARQHRLKPRGHETNSGPQTVVSLVLVFFYGISPKNRTESPLYRVLGENLLYPVQL